MVLPINPCDFGNPEPCGVNPAFTYTRYPCDFDDPRPVQDTRGLPVIVDLQTPVKAEVVNRHRETILAIEAELGIQPSGTFTTVRSRLDALDGMLCNIWNTIINAGSPVDVKFNGESVVVGVRSINFFGPGVTVTNAGGVQADVEITGGGSLCNVPIHEALAVIGDGQTVFTLTYPPYKNLLFLFIEGIKQEIGHYTVNGMNLTWSGIPLLTTDTVEVFYTIKSMGDGYEPVNETVPITANGQTNFTLTDEAWNNLAVLFIGGIKQELSDYTVNGNQLVWNGISLLTTDIIEVLYYQVVMGDKCGGRGGGGGVPIMHQDVFIAGAAQTAFNLSYIPFNQQSTELFINGLSQTIIIDYIVSGSTVIYSGIPALVGGETVVVKYFEG